MYSTQGSLTLVLFEYRWHCSTLKGPKRWFTSDIIHSSGHCVFFFVVFLGGTHFDLSLCQALCEPRPLTASCVNFECLEVFCLSKCWMWVEIYQSQAWLWWRGRERELPLTLIYPSIIHPGLICTYSYCKWKNKKDITSTTRSLFFEK